MKLLVPTAILLFLAAYVMPLGVRPLVTPDETRYAEIPREMIVSGNWVSPTLDGFRYFEKPILGYWLNAASILAFGQNNFAVRLPTALSVGLSALFIFLIFQRSAGGGPRGVLAAMIFMTCVFVFGVGTFNVLDSLLSMLFTGAMVAFFFAFHADTPKTRRLVYLALFGVFCGLALMAKGFLALVVPAMVIVPWLIWQRRLVEFLRLCVIPIALGTLVALPWTIAIHHRQPDFWHYFFWVEHVQRFTRPNAGQHPYGAWYFIPVVLAGALPWTALLGCIIAGLRSTGIKDPLVRFCLCWSAIPFVFFSLSSGKLATYILPCFAPLAVLITIGLERYFTIDTRDFCRSSKTFIAVITIVAAGLIAVQVLPIQTTVEIGKHIVDVRLYSADEPHKLPLLIACLAAYAFFLYMSIRVTDWRNRILMCCMGPMVLYAVGPFALPHQVFIEKAPAAVLLRRQEGFSPTTTLVADRYTVSAVCWSYNRNDVYLMGSAGELKYGTEYPDTKGRVLAPDTFSAFIASQPVGSHIMLITAPDRYRDYAHIITQPASLVTEEGLIIADFRRPADIAAPGL